MDHHCFANYFPQPRAMGSLTLILQPCNRILQLGCFHSGRSWSIWINLTVTLGLKQIFHLFLTNSTRNLTAHPLHHAELRCESPDEKEDFISSYVTMHGWNYTWEARMRSKVMCGCISLSGIQRRCPRLAMEDTHQKNQRNPKWTSSGTPFLITSPSSSLPHLPHSTVNFSMPLFKKFMKSFPNSLLIFCIYISNTFTLVNALRTS